MTERLNKAVAGQSLTLYRSDGSRREFTVSGIRGEGGSSVVYEACTPDGMRGIIKEFYPLCMEEDISRRSDDGGLSFPEGIMSEPLYRDKAERFLGSAELMNLFAYNEDTAEETLTAQTLNSSGGVPYIIMEWNPLRVSCYENVETSSLNEIATVCLRLAETLSRYHAAGYYLYDIKPANILWSARYGYIKLFDFDTADRAENLSTKRIMSTPGYNAPETEVRGYPSNVGSAADVYSVGAILFERVMGRKVCPEKGDRISFSYEREIESRPLCRKEDDASLRLLNNILRGTICAAPGKRLTDEALIILLTELTRSTRAEPRSMTELPDIKEYESFFERETALLRSIITGTGKAAVTSESVGMGKTLTALLYAARYKNKYSQVIFVSCGRKYPTDAELLRRYSPDTLVIMDNCGSADITELSRISGISAHILMTTRCAVKNAVTVQPLTSRQAGIVFGKYCPDHEPPSSLLSELGENPLLLKMSAEHNGARPKDFITEEIALSVIGELSPDECTVLRSLSLFVNSRISRGRFSELSGCPEDALDSLISSGLVRENDGVIRVDTASAVLWSRLPGEYSRKLIKNLREMIKSDHALAGSVAEYFAGIGYASAKLYIALGDIMIGSENRQKALEMFGRAKTILSVQYKNSALLDELDSKIQSLR